MVFSPDPDNALLRLNAAPATHHFTEDEFIGGADSMSAMTAKIAILSTRILIPVTLLSIRRSKTARIVINKTVFASCEGSWCAVCTRSYALIKTSFKFLKLEQNSRTHVGCFCLKSAR